MSAGHVLRIVLLANLLSIAPLTRSRADYKLGPQDKVRIKVYEWRSASGQVYEWTALGGEFVVGAGGSVSLPLLGDMPAANRAPSELAAAISDGLQARIGLAQRPDTAVDVIQYRPFYILGYVDKPGEYAYLPGMTVLEAISLAGGLFRAADFRRFEREAIASKGELQIVMVERSALVARQARLEAELQGAETTTFPPELTDQKANPALAELMREEESLFASQRETLRSQLESLWQVKSLLQREIKSMEAKTVSLQRQQGLARRELDNINSLLDRGLATASRKLALEQTTAQFESARLDLDLLMLRAQQDISKTDRDAADLVNRRHNEVLMELGTVRGKLAAMAERRLTLESLIYDSEVIAPQRSRRAADPQQKPKLNLIRRAAGETQSSVVREVDTVHPGDVVQVQVEMPMDAWAVMSTTQPGTLARETVGAQRPTR